MESTEQNNQGQNLGLGKKLMSLAVGLLLVGLTFAAVVTAIGIVTGTGNLTPGFNSSVNFTSQGIIVNSTTVNFQNMPAGSWFDLKGTVNNNANQPMNNVYMVAAFDDAAHDFVGTEFVSGSYNGSAMTICGGGIGFGGRMYVRTTTPQSFGANSSTNWDLNITSDPFASATNMTMSFGPVKVGQQAC